MALDGLRGVAALLVMAHHIGLLSGYPQLAPMGFLAVDLFFLLSGFVIAQAYEERFAAGLGVARFAAIRVIRLYPLIFVGLVLGALWSLVARDGALNAASLVNFLLLPALSGQSAATFPFDVPVWSLFFEIVINIVHAAVLWRLGWRGLGLVVLVAGTIFIAAIIHYHSPSLGWEARTLWVGFARVTASYGGGMLLHRLIGNRRATRWRVPLIVPPLVLVAVLHGPLPPLWTVERGIAIVFLVFPAIVLMAIHQQPEGRAGAALAWLGRLSFPLYAIHLPIVTFAARLIVNQPPAAGPLLWLLFVFLIVAAALALEDRVDLPLRRWIAVRMARAERAEEPPVGAE